MRATRFVGGFIARDWRVAVSYRSAYVLELIAIVTSLVLFYYLGRLVNPSVQGLTRAGGYFDYVAVGLAFLLVLQIGVSAFARHVRDEQLTGTFEVLMSSPAPSGAIVLASAAYELLRGLVAAVLLIVLATIFFGMTPHMGLASGVACAGLVAGTIGLFAVLGVFVAAFTVAFKQTTGILVLLFNALALFAGAYFPLALLPNWLEDLAQALPFTWSLRALRDAILRDHVDGLRLAGVWAAVAVGLAVALPAFELALRYARRRGTLGHY